MDEITLKLIALQLRKPEGEMGLQVAEKMNRSNEMMNKWSIEQLQVSPMDNILEIGMGNGLFARDILSNDATVKYAGCDYSETMVMEACSLNKQFIENGQARFIHANADKLPFGDHTFDKVFTVNTIYFWSKPSRELAEIHRILKPGGLLIIAIRPEAIMKNYPFTAYGFRLYDEGGIRTLLAENRFSVTEVLEKEEPEQEIGGETIKAATMVVSAISQ
jgi:ubiquinone/menaquinone biosynthesis C-methylase UbiE